MAILALLGTAAAAVLAVVLVFAADNTEKGTGQRAKPIVSATQQAKLVPINLAQQSPEAYDPLGGDGEHDEQATAVVDGQVQSSWSTETYDAGALSKDGVGIMVDADPGVAARLMQIRTPSPGFTASVYVAKEEIPTQAPGQGDGWIMVSNPETITSGVKIDLDTAAQPYRRYLVWITALADGTDKAAISELYLYR